MWGFPKIWLSRNHQFFSLFFLRCNFLELFLSTRFLFCEGLNWNSGIVCSIEFADVTDLDLGFIFEVVFSRIDITVVIVYFCLDALKVYIGGFTKIYVMVDNAATSLHRH